ncbi:nicotinate-nucleotide adenylyltransferase [Mesobacillus maritimus]|uniref:nicotinate-nucleotide adenylyltransferase n=1 Tax=Mesobacillus maritimus TaxID=1643336 RepID=UPI002040236C|nr:nicotinate-nucleotide adenylyltransferase [Mesobacillus maritimus]MCM3588857.1 nicotinate-nucleotide adenylyltransferase [Mesobacillus maritimus]MCM3669993.1 nicotinate-nucleotide adenylyltransferase [Mesobacillus maritimus]
MKKIGILGGTFNPPHVGHLLIANEVHHALGLEEVWFMPNHEPPHKKKEGKVTDKQRLEMLELAISGNPHFSIEPIELKRQGPSYTYETMKILTEQYKDYKFHFIIGGDMIEYLPKWYKIDELHQMIQFVGVNRPRYSSQSDYSILLVKTPAIDLSSSFIRERRIQGGTIRYLVPENVRNYIEENGLYGP